MMRLLVFEGWHRCQLALKAPRLILQPTWRNQTLQKSTCFDIVQNQNEDEHWSKTSLRFPFRLQHIWRPVLRRKCPLQLEPKYLRKQWEMQTKLTCNRSNSLMPAASCQQRMSMALKKCWAYELGEQTLQKLTCVDFCLTKTKLVEHKSNKFALALA